MVSIGMTMSPHCRLPTIKPSQSRIEAIVTLPNLYSANVETKVVSAGINMSTFDLCMLLPTFHGIAADRCDVLKDANTPVVRLTETLVARVVQDREGPRQGTKWFAAYGPVNAGALQQSMVARAAVMPCVFLSLSSGTETRVGRCDGVWRHLRSRSQRCGPGCCDCGKNGCSPRWRGRHFHDAFLAAAR